MAVKTARQALAIAALTSFVFFALEALLLAALDVTTSYFQAQMIIATSLLGLLVGTFAAAAVKKEHSLSYVRFLVATIWVLPLLSLGLVLLSFSYSLLTIVGLLLVFAPLGFILSALYWFASPWQLYASELLGAVGGLGFFMATVVTLRSENGLLALAAIAATASALFLRRSLQISHLIALLAVSVAVGSFLLANIFNHYINLVLHTVCVPDRVPSGYTANKIACLDDEGVAYQLEISLGSLQNRIDIYKTSTDGFYFTAYSGIRNDLMQPFPPAAYDQDARIPAGLIANPKTLILGAGAEGVAKVAKAIGAEDITIVEYNPAVLKIWNENLPYAESAYHPLANTNVIRGDARQFVQTTEETYDIITLMNTHRSLFAAQFGFPDFLHTKEALLAYFDVLSPDGFLSIEEVSYLEAGDRTIARRIQTILHSLTVQGIADPRAHIVVYQWVGMMKDEVPAPAYDLVYTQILVKKEPWQAEELAQFRAWAEHSQQTNEFKRPANMTFYRPVWYPDTGLQTELATSSVINQPFRFDDKELPLLTDAAPFARLLSVVDRTATYTFVFMSGLIGLVCLLWYRRTTMDYAPAWLGYFFLIGLGYMAIEMFLLLWLQLYLGSILVTLVTVIGGLFVASAFASLLYQTRQFSVQELALRSATAVALVASAYIFSWPQSSVAIHFVLAISITVTVGILLAPLFPSALRHVEAQFRQATPLLIGVNSVALAVAVPGTIFLATFYGFTTVLVVTAGIYTGALAILYKLQ